MSNNKYKWHDLTADPEDLPNESGMVLTVGLIEYGRFIERVCRVARYWSINRAFEVEDKRKYVIEGWMPIKRFRRVRDESNIF